MLADFFAEALERAQDPWRRVVARAAELGIPTPAFSSSLAYYDGYRRATGPASLIQGLRDLFGAHTYQRVDREGTFHTMWSGRRPRGPSRTDLGHTSAVAVVNGISAHANLPEGPTWLTRTPNRSHTESPTTLLSTTRGKLVLALLCAVAFIDFVDASIVNIALPSIRRSLHFSEQGLQWVPSAYLLTYGGFMLLGGRLADLIGRRRVLVAGTVVIGIASLIGGLAQHQRRARRRTPGAGARSGADVAGGPLDPDHDVHPPSDRRAALGVWGGVGGLASAAGVLFGGLLTEGLGWRWVMFVNPVAIVFVLAGIRR